MRRFRESSHGRAWLVASREALRARKQECNRRAFAALIDDINRQAAIKLSSDDAASGGGGGGGGIEERRAKVVRARTLSVEEEDVLKRYYLLKLAEFVKLDVPLKVVATAIVYFKRFFLVNPVTHHDPRTTMYPRPPSSRREARLTTQTPLHQGWRHCTWRPRWRRWCYRPIALPPLWASTRYARTRRLVPLYLGIGFFSRPNRTSRDSRPMCSRWRFRSSRVCNST